MSSEVEQVRELLAGTQESPKEVASVDETEVIEDEAIETEVSEDETLVASVEGEEGDAEDTDEGGESEAEAYSVASLADAIGWEPEDLYDVEVAMGEGVEPVKLGELKDEYQQVLRDKAVLETAVKDLEAKTGEISDISQMGAGVSQEMISAFADMESIKREYNAINWAQEEQTDPGRAALAKQKYQEAFNAAQGKVAQAEQNMKVYQSQTVQQAAAKMFEMMPDWKNPEVRKADQGRIRELMRSKGYSDQVINGIKDPKAMVMLKEYADMKDKLAQYETAGEQAVNKVRKAPKVIGAKGAKKMNNQKLRLKKAKENLERSKRGKPGRGGVRRSDAELDMAKAILGAR